MKIAVITSDFGAALHMGADVTREVVTFELPDDVAAYIQSQQSECTTVTLAIVKEPSHDR